MRLWGILLLFISNISWAQIYTVETTPNPKVVNNTFVSDPTEILEDSVVNSINNSLTNLENQTTTQVAVVLLPSIGEADLFDFSQRLFEKWGIGQRDQDNGLLILFVLDQRTVRFHTGFGLEGILPDVLCKRIQQELMVPYFKNGDYNKGMLLGTNEVIRILIDPSTHIEITKRQTIFRNDIFTFYGFLLVVTILFLPPFLEAKKKNRFKYEPHQLKLWLPWWWWAVLYYVPVAVSYYSLFPIELRVIYLLHLYLFVMLLLVERYLRLFYILQPYLKEKHFQDAYNFMMSEKRYWKVSSIIFPLPFLALYFYYLKKANAYRNHPVICKNCGKLCRKLNEEAEDQFLVPGQQVEEKIQSIDYDVWNCDSCGAFESIPYIHSATEFSVCPNCSYNTSHCISKRTLLTATYGREGKGEEVFNCVNCQFHRIVPFIIPQLTASSSSSNSSSSSDSGSFGGGSSGGGGASSTW